MQTGMQYVIIKRKSHRTRGQKRARTGKEETMEIRDRSVIVFAGDSTTDAGKCLTQDGLGDGYVKLVHDALIAFRPENSYRIVNAGVSGNRSCDLLARWDADVSACKPDLVFCMIGINDVWRHFDSLEYPDHLVSEEEYRENLKEICEKSKEIKQLIFMTPFFMERNKSDEMRAMTDAYRKAMQEVAAAYGRPFIDTQEEFDVFMKARAGQSISWDRVHPNRIGSMLLARLILRTLGCL